MTWAAWPFAMTVGCSSSESSTGTGQENDTSVPADVTEPVDALEQADISEPSDVLDPEDITDPDVSNEPITTVAFPSVRCDLKERIGVIELSGLTDEPPSPYLVATLDDRPNPWYGDPALTSNACRHHAFSPTGICANPCESDETCSIDGQCVPSPRRRKGAVVRLVADGDSQTFTADAQLGYLEGAITLPGKTFALEITWPGHIVTMAAAEAPAALPQLAGILVGSYDAPEKITVTWTPVEEGTHAHTLIPINHHAAGPTFTECAIDASVGVFEVPEAMLTPLAVSTGLEFQGVEHVRFAAAETPEGCVEIRFVTRQYVSLGF